MSEAALLNLEEIGPYILVKGSITELQFFIKTFLNMIIFYCWPMGSRSKSTSFTKKKKRDQNKQAMAWFGYIYIYILFLPHIYQ